MKTPLHVPFHYEVRFINHWGERVRFNIYGTFVEAKAGLKAFKVAWRKTNGKSKVRTKSSIVRVIEEIVEE